MQLKEGAVLDGNYSPPVTPSTQGGSDETALHEQRAVSPRACELTRVATKMPENVPSTPQPEAPIWNATRCETLRKRARLLHENDRDIGSESAQVLRERDAECLCSAKVAIP
jgi:hypothetical protein